MRIRAGTFDGCSASWAVAFSAIGIYLLIAKGLGFFSLILVGLILAGGCLNSELSLDYPLERRRAQRFYGPERSAPEQQAASAASRHNDILCLRAGRWCGLSVAALGLAGLWWNS